MPRRSKRYRPIPPDKDEIYEKIALDAKHRAYELLLCSLLRRGGSLMEEDARLVCDVAEALNLPFHSAPLHERVVFANSLSEESGAVDDDTSSTGKKRRRSSRLRKMEDVHNEECEVCDREGDLLCCDTCSLVYHVGCVRPKLDTVPTGNWYCPYCLLDSMQATTGRESQPPAPPAHDLSAEEMARDGYSSISSDDDGDNEKSVGLDKVDAGVTVEDVRLSLRLMAVLRAAALHGVSTETSNFGEERSVNPPDSEDGSSVCTTTHTDLRSTGGDLGSGGKDSKSESTLSCRGASRLRTDHLHPDLVVSRCGGRWLLKRAACARWLPGEELARCWTLEEALQALRSHSSPPTPDPPFLSLHQQPQQITQRDRPGKHKANTRRERSGGRWSREGRQNDDDGDRSVGDEDSSHTNDDDEGLWCQYCIDDPTIPICCFCGCRSCFGKQDSSYLLLCDGCDVEFHTYCLDPPLTEVPEGAWYCSHCVDSGSADKEEDNMSSPPAQAQPQPLHETQAKGFKIASAASPTPAAPPARRGRGRPRGSTNLRARVPSTKVDPYTRLHTSKTLTQAPGTVSVLDANGEDGVDVGAGPSKDELMEWQRTHLKKLKDQQLYLPMNLTTAQNTVKYMLFTGLLKERLVKTHPTASRSSSDAGACGVVDFAHPTDADGNAGSMPLQALPDTGDSVKSSSVTPASVDTGIPVNHREEYFLHQFAQWAPKRELKELLKTLQQEKKKTIEEMQYSHPDKYADFIGGGICGVPRSPSYSVVDVSAGSASDIAAKGLGDGCSVPTSTTMVEVDGVPTATDAAFSTSNISIANEGAGVPAGTLSAVNGSRSVQQSAFARPTQQAPCGSVRADSASPMPSILTSTTNDLTPDSGSSGRERRLVKSSSINPREYDSGTVLSPSSSEAGATALTPGAMDTSMAPVLGGAGSPTSIPLQSTPSATTSIAAAVVLRNQDQTAAQELPVLVGSPPRACPAVESESANQSPYLQDYIRFSMLVGQQDTSTVATALPSMPGPAAPMFGLELLPTPANGVGKQAESNRSCVDGSTALVLSDASPVVVLDHNGDTLMSTDHHISEILFHEKQGDPESHPMEETEE